MKLIGALLTLVLWASVFCAAAAQNGFLQSLGIPDSSMVEIIGGQDLQDEALQQAIAKCLLETDRQRQIDPASYAKNNVISTNKVEDIIPDSQPLPPFPAFDNRPLTDHEYKLMLSVNCKPSFEMIECSRWNTVEIFCNTLATKSEASNITELFRYSKRGTRILMSGGETLSSEVLNPVRKNVVDLEIIQCPTQTTLSKLPSLQLSSLVSMDVNGCENIIIKKRDFAYNQRLRIILFTSSTIASIEKYTFMDLPQLALLSLEYGIQPPFSQSQISHLQRFHCDCEYSWLRNWFTENPYVIAEKLQYEAVGIDSVTNPATKQTHIFYAVDCRSSVTRYTPRSYQSTYSVNAEC